MVCVAGPRLHSPVDWAEIHLPHGGSLAVSVVSVFSELNNIADESKITGPVMLL